MGLIKIKTMRKRKPELILTIGDISKKELNETRTLLTKKIPDWLIRLKVEKDFKGAEVSVKNQPRVRIGTHFQCCITIK
jgi:hypothetical protein